MSRQDDRGRKALLWIGLAVNITVLFLFKSVGTFLDAIAFMHGPRLAPPNWGLPLGVSFFTFTQIIYLSRRVTQRAPTSPAALRIFQRADGARTRCSSTRRSCRCSRMWYPVRWSRPVHRAADRRRT